MNKENLLKMAEYIETIPQEKFDMSKYRTDDYNTIECNSVGCVIGHCVILDPNPELIPRFLNGGIVFERWSSSFIGFSPFAYSWKWCFDAAWTKIDNTPQGAAKRIRYLV